ncbi:hypothetical protein ACJMK2_033124 [Sinanodonta woodiana]|uniref:Ankyrin repeat domain-containing protein 50 n=1 Tax=Sinanodonta woodiana TaxID=1069815 RepID=A0ABD3X5E2_SINWO
MTSCLLEGKRYFCREWTFSKINHCLENRPTSKTCGALIMGGPGCGKTAMCCELVWPTVADGKQNMLSRRLLAYHFCQAHDIETLSITRFIQNIVAQILKSDLITGYREKIQDQVLLNCETNPDKVFQEAFINPLNEITPPNQTVFILVDSIDESYLQCINERADGSKTIAELLAHHHHLFPQWLLLVCSCRKQSKSVTRLFTGFRKISLDDLRKSHVIRDVQQYILCRLDKEAELRQHLSKETAEMLNQLHIKSNGCFLYLEKVLDGVAENFIMLREIREIPGTLNGLYLWLCQRLFVRKQFSKIQPILNVILASRKPLSDEELFSCARTRNTLLTKDDLDRRLKLLSKILITSPDGRHILFHHSFAEWLLDVKHCTQKYLCNAADGHAMLSMSATLNSSSLGPEEVQDFAFHLVRSNFHPPVQHHHLVQWLLLSGANVENCLSFGMPKEQKVLKLLLDAGADPTCDKKTSHVDAACMKESLTMETPEDTPKIPCDIDNSVDQVDVNGKTLLHTASHQGNIHIFNLLIAKCANIEAVDKSGQTPLILASRQGHKDIVSALLKAGADTDHADSDGWTALRAAAWSGHTSVVFELLDHGASVDHADADQRTALRAAAWGGHEDIVIKLLEHGADVNKADNEGRTALIAAAYMGHTEIVEHLLNYEANINHEDCDGRTALSVAALCIPASEGHEKVVSLLLERGAEVDHQDHDGMTPLLVAAYEGHHDVCELLLEWDADVDHTDKNGRSALLLAASMGHAKVVTQLLFWGTAVHTIDSEGRTVLSIASAQGNIGIVQQLLDRGLDELHRDNSGWTPLHFAAYEGHKEVCELLIEHLAKVNEIDNEGRHPLILAAQEGHLPVVSTLIDHGSHVNQRSHDGRTALRVAVLEGHRDVVEYLLNMDADINYKDADGRSTLYVVSLENKFEIASFLLDKGADFEAVDLEGRSSLHVAAWQGHYEMVEILIQCGANVNAVDNDERSALQSAAWQGHERVVRLLLEKGAAVDHTCNQGATALCIAAQEGHEDVVRVLLQFRANPNHADQFGRTPIRVALKSGHSNVVKILEDFGASPASGTKSRSSSSTSSTNNDIKPSTSHAVTRTTFSSGINNLAGSNAVASISSGAPAVLNGHHLNSSPSDSPDSTFDRRKSIMSNNSSKSSSNMTSSTNQSSTLSSAQTRPDGECLTFTQQLQQCSLGRNRGRPVSRVLSPVSEPLSPVQSPIGSPMVAAPHTTIPNLGYNIYSPVLEKSLNMFAANQVKHPDARHDHITTINIITNPNADISDDSIWQLNPLHRQSVKNSIALLESRRNKTPDQPSKTIMGQSALEMRSPETRTKRNGIVTNPNLHKPKVLNTCVNSNINMNIKKYGHLENGDCKFKVQNGSSSNGVANGHHAFPDQHKGPIRPNGLPLKKETPL